MDEEILLSILTPSIPSRLEMLKALCANIQTQMPQPSCVEHLVLIDAGVKNNGMTIGRKREALMQMSRSKFSLFLDDDDDASPRLCHEIIAAIRHDPNVDVITFQQHAVISGKDGDRKFTVDFGLEYEIEQAQVLWNGQFKDIRRKPWTCCAWRTALAKTAHFPDEGREEDFKWLQQLWPRAKTEFHIGAVLHTYRYNEETSEGDQTIDKRKAEEEAAALAAEEAKKEGE